MESGSGEEDSHALEEAGIVLDTVFLQGVSELVVLDDFSAVVGFELENVDRGIRRSHDIEISASNIECRATKRRMNLLTLGC